MHVKYKQDNLHHMTWYTIIYDSIGRGHTIHVSFVIKCVCYIGLWIHWFRDHGATIPNGLITIEQMSLVGVGYSRSDSIVPLMLHTVCCAMAGVLALYYRSLGTASIPLRKGNISGILYCWIINVVYVICIYHLLYISCIK